ncbi:MAG: AbrB/MazE/SpoVT family DNA-binding domain-containing protein [Acidobacteriota bacterium]|nr:AbrB/MazE/SpoVT family DNA-binding domain-containing protein [Acidobacteriota bacterium]
MAGATLTSKGQVTIPKGIRDLLGLEAGDQLDFVVEGQARVVLRPGNRDARGLRGLLHRPRRKPVTLAKMDAAIRNQGRTRKR